MYELLYVDRDRLQSYAEQSAQRVRQVPAYSGASNLTGPSVSAAWTGPQLMKIHDQLGAVREYLARENFLSYQRPSEADRWYIGGAGAKPTAGSGVPRLAIFREETLELQSVFMAPTKRDPLLKNGLSLWLSDSPHEQGLLLLIEQFPFPDSHFARALSGYTLLAMVSEELLPPHESSKIMGTRRDPRITGIGRDTRGVLEKFGARIGPSKIATVLYRVRATFAEKEQNFSITTIGYPIAIWQE